MDVVADQRYGDDKMIIQLHVIIYFLDTFRTHNHDNVRVSKLSFQP